MLNHIFCIYLLINIIFPDIGTVIGTAKKNFFIPIENKSFVLEYARVVFPTLPTKESAMAALRFLKRHSSLLNEHLGEIWKDQNPLLIPAEIASILENTSNDNNNNNNNNNN